MKWFSGKCVVETLLKYSLLGVPSAVPFPIPSHKLSELAWLSGRAHCHWMFFSHMKSSRKYLPLIRWIEYIFWHLSEEATWACRNFSPAWVQSRDQGATALQCWPCVTLPTIHACLVLKSTKLGDSKIWPSDYSKSQMSMVGPKALMVAAKLSVSYPYLLWKNQHRFRSPNLALRGGGILYKHRFTLNTVK